MPLQWWLSNKRRVLKERQSGRERVMPLQWWLSNKRRVLKERQSGRERVMPLQWWLSNKRRVLKGKRSGMEKVEKRQMQAKRETSTLAPEPRLLFLLLVQMSGGAQFATNAALNTHVSAHLAAAASSAMNAQTKSCSVSGPRSRSRLDKEEMDEQMGHSCADAGSLSDAQCAAVAVLYE